MFIHDDDPSALLEVLSGYVRNIDTIKKENEALGIDLRVVEGSNHILRQEVSQLKDKVRELLC